MSNNFGKIAKRWREIQGDSNWENLLDQPDKDLRLSIINYGEMAQAAYDGFNQERRSPNLGAARYKESNLLQKVQVSMPNAYTITKYLYATSSIDVPDAFIVKLPSKESNWMGFVAVATHKAKALLGRRDILVAWRGTIQTLEWVNDFDCTLTSASELVGPTEPDDGEPMVHRGFLSIYTSDNPNSRFDKRSSREQVLTETAKLMDKYSNEETSITITGHSLGAALSTLCAIDIASKHLNCPSYSRLKSCPVTAIIFASPRVGDYNFQKAYSKQLDLKLLRVRNVMDIVPNVPPPNPYCDVGVELTIDLTKSPYIKNPGDAVTWHNLENYLHGVAGMQKDGFRLEVDRDIALVNKSADILKDVYPVPVAWFVNKNKDMVKGNDGRWRLDDSEGEADK
ncbi:Phospholipase A1 [Rhynchospora pubera]|uniref:Phospholipase A1 n=1 Tax=Rhynchospora pubera TaxID=906938 RepID=A0AAV8F4G2_9POAL|nr:Phospholipase A1 [Rhynchospora pubera]